jgi:hypothetical protein
MANFGHATGDPTRTCSSYREINPIPVMDEDTSALLPDCLSDPDESCYVVHYGFAKNGQGMVRIFSTLADVRPLRHARAESNAFMEGSVPRNAPHALSSEASGEAA